MIVWSSQPWKNFYCSAFLKPMPNSSSFSRSLLTLMTFCLRLSVEFSFLIFVLSQLITANKHQKSVFFNKNCKYLRPLLEVNRLAKFVRLCFNVLCFILALFSLQWFILSNRTRSWLFLLSKWKVYQWGIICL
jgi:hypothetical protein